MDWLLVLAILAQSADATYSCKAPNGGRELNPLLGQSCRSVVLRKSAAFTPILVLPPKYGVAWKAGLIGGGVGGLTVSIVLNK